MYQEQILEHFRHPHNSGKIDDATIVQKEVNPTCGDTLTFYLVVKDGVIQNISFEGEGCAISQASASMVTDEVLGKKIADVLQWQKEDVLDLLGITLGPTRLRCALLSLQGIGNALGQSKAL